MSKHSNCCRKASEAIDVRYMRRALQLALNGCGYTSPNPMVGAVVVAPDGRIIGEGWHRQFGGPHAEVNAINSISTGDEHLIPQSTIYVTLEPCSHYGKTPPCAKLLIDKGIGRVVVGVGDPNPRVSGRGIGMLRNAGIPVDTFVLENECYEINRPFMTAHSLGRPFVTLKWARSADGFMDILRQKDEAAARFSTPLTQQLTHRRRSLHDAIAVGAGTVLWDNPGLDVRAIAGRSPRPIIFDRHNIISANNCKIFDNAIHIASGEPIDIVLSNLYKQGITSLLVEGGASLLKEFLAADLWDDIYEEVAPFALGERGRVEAPVIPYISKQDKIDGNIINYCRHS